MVKTTLNHLYFKQKLVKLKFDYRKKNVVVQAFWVIRASTSEAVDTGSITSVVVFTALQLVAWHSKKTMKYYYLGFSIYLYKLK